MLSVGAEDHGVVLDACEHKWESCADCGYRWCATCGTDDTSNVHGECEIAEVPDDEELFVDWPWRKADEENDVTSSRKQYDAFLASKTPTVIMNGLEEVPPLHESLFPFQRELVAWALRRGRAALFADTGLGKSRMQIEWARVVAEHTGERVLILCPLAVAGQTVREGRALGVDVRYVRDEQELSVASSQLVIANYERLDRFDAKGLSGVVLDESSILKNYMGKTKRALQEAFAATLFRLCCSATPAPNDHLELGNHSEFLGVLSSHEMIARWFINDTSTFGTYRLKRHAVEPFWDWVSSWAQCVGKPSDMGHSDDGYILPPLRIEKRIVEVDITAGRENGALFRVPEMSATSVHHEKRMSAQARADLAVDLMRSEPEESWLIWAETDYEAEAALAAAEKLGVELTEVHGSDSLESKEAKLEAFANGTIRRLLTKPKIAGLGLNWQLCARMVFLGASYSYEAFYQAARRCWRFGQRRDVLAYVLLGSGELAIWDVLMRKQQDHESMKLEMLEAMRRRRAKEDNRRQSYVPTKRVQMPDWIRTET